VAIKVKHRLGNPRLRNAFLIVGLHGRFLMTWRFCAFCFFGKWRPARETMAAPTKDDVVKRKLSTIAVDAFSPAASQTLNMER
jgi:hypothetical protein